MKKIFFVLLFLFSSLVNINQAKAAIGDTDTYVTLNGTTQYVSAASSNSFILTDSFTVEAWIKPDSTCIAAVECMIFNKENIWEFAIRSGTLYYALNGATNWVWQNTYESITAGIWTHVAVTRAASSAALKVYLNGHIDTTTANADGLGTGTFSADTGREFTVGARYNAGTRGSFFSGGIDEVRVWRANRSDAQILQDAYTWNATDTTGLITYIDFNDISGTTVYNRASGGTNLSTAGSPTISNVAVTDLTKGDGKTYITFPRSYLTANGGWLAPSGVSQIDALVVAGGGGGGFGNLGGGGGGGGVAATNKSISVSPGSNYQIVVGQGGSGSPHDSAVSSKWRNGNSGDTSTAFGATAIGGGGGGGSNSTINGAAGGSGGGSASGGTGGSSIGSAPNSSWTYYGNSGGSAASAGGGGAGASGGTSSSGTIGVTIFGLNIAGGGPGWAGIQISPTYGTGMSVSAAGNYGCPGGQSNCDGTANTGGGGGAGGSGGSGVVVIRYVNSFSVSISYSGTPLKTTKSAGAITITASTTSTGTVTFYANGRPINRCVSVPVSGTTATCLWRPMTHGQQYLTARYTSNDTFYNGSVTSSILNTNTGRRSTSR